MTLKPYTHSTKGKKDQVSEMFTTISKEYDGLNRLITFGMDIRWRKKVIRTIAKETPEKLLDIATGTGDLAIMAAQKTKASEIVGVDISEGMLAVGRKKIEELGFSHRIQMLMGDSENLSFSTARFDAITVAFGIRNFENLDKGLQELYRVLKPGGILVVLETSVPKSPILKPFYLFYSHIVVPLLGKLFSKDAKAYSYLSRSAKKFPYGEELNNILRKNGFKEVEDKPQSLGVVRIYVGRKFKK